MKGLTGVNHAMNSFYFTAAYADLAVDTGILLHQFLLCFF